MPQFTNSSRLFRIVLAAAAATTLASPSLASFAPGGYITQVTPQNTGVMFVTVDDARATPAPSCGAGQPMRWAIDTTNSAGQAMAAAALTAFAQHKQVFIAGTEACTSWGDTENISYFNVAS